MADNSAVGFFSLLGSREAGLQSVQVSELEQHRVLLSPGQPIDQIYLVESGLVSVLSPTEDGRSVETAIIGRGGVVGANVLLGAERATVQAIVAIEGAGSHIRTAQFLDLVESSPSIRDDALRSIDSQLVQSQRNALCHSLHSVEERFCRWLLQASDALSTDAFILTQEFFVPVLGVQRTTISMIAHALQCAGAIRTVRGRISLLDKGKLADRACPCYARSKSQPGFTSRDLVQRRAEAVLPANG